MGNALTGGGLTGGATGTPGSTIAPAGQSAILAGPLGAGGADVVTKIGSTQPDASVNAAAVLASFRTGIGGSETESLAILKGGVLRGDFGSLTMRGSFGLLLQYVTTVLMMDSATITMGGAVGNVTQLNGATGALGIRGTDSSGTPGNVQIDKPSGKSAIAIGAASVTITNSLCTAASRLMLTFHARDATGLLPIGVPGAGSFTVTTVGNCTAALPFSWEINSII